MFYLKLLILFGFSYSSKNHKNTQQAILKTEYHDLQKNDKRILPKIQILQNDLNLVITSNRGPVYVALGEINNVLCLFWYGTCINYEELENPKIFDKYGNVVGLQLVPNYNIDINGNTCLVYYTGSKTYKKEIKDLNKLIYCKMIELEEYTIFGYAENIYFKTQYSDQDCTYFPTKQGIIIHHKVPEIYQKIGQFYEKVNVQNIIESNSGFTKVLEHIVDEEIIKNAYLIMEGKSPSVNMPSNNHSILWKQLWEIEQAISYDIIVSLSENLEIITNLLPLIEFYPIEFKKYIYTRICCAAYSIRNIELLEFSLCEILALESYVFPPELEYWNQMLNTKFLDPKFLINIEDIELYISKFETLTPLHQQRLLAIKHLPPINISDNYKLIIAFNNPRNWQNLDQILKFIDLLSKEGEYILAYIMIEKYLFKNNGVLIHKKLKHIPIFMLTFNSNKIFGYLITPSLIRNIKNLIVLVKKYKIY